MRNIRGIVQNFKYILCCVFNTQFGSYDDLRNFRSLNYNNKQWKMYRT